MCAALGTSGAYAASMIGSQNVTDESLLSQDIKNDTLTGADIQEAALSGLKVSGVAVVRSKSASDSSGSKAPLVICPAGKRLMGTGYILDNTAAPDVAVTAVAVPNDASGVQVVAKERVPTGNPWSLEAIGICVTAE
jgi:hypothetical protein